MLKNNIKLLYFTIIISCITLILYHVPFFEFVFNNLDYKNFSGITIITSLIFMMFALNTFVFYFIFSISKTIGKILLAFFFIINSISVYFIKSYNIIIDETMIGNLLNTNYEESSAYFSWGLILWLLVLGIFPSFLSAKTKIIAETFKRKIIILSSLIFFIVALAYFNSSNWLWIDKNSTKLGALVMPWSYVVNTSRFYIHENQKSKKEILLPNASISDNKKSILVLMIGESARSENFSLYGYKKKTNPLLSSMDNLYSFKANSCATYTTAGLKCILEHTNTNKLYEILPNYLYRNDVEVIWRTTNWGEPPIRIKKILKRSDLEKDCLGVGCNYDEVLLNGLKRQILETSKDKLLIVLHTSTSHGPTYNKKYPPIFELFKPVCTSVELAKCTNEELINAYDNTIVYTDYLIANVIETLKTLENYNSAMIYVSDHGESLGENNLYLHGMPNSIAPKEQLEIPFIVWVSENSKKLKKSDLLSQNHVFHSVLNFLSVESPIYNESMNIFK